MRRSIQSTQYAKHVSGSLGPFDTRTDVSEIPDKVRAEAGAEAADALAKSLGIELTAEPT